jgi:hypothetical protein
MDDGTRATPNWLSFSLQVALVAGTELADDVAHTLTGESNARLGEVDALRLVQFERLHDLWIEPAVQRFFERSHDVCGLAFGWLQVVPFFDAIYGPGHIIATLSFAIWIYLRRRSLFRVVRNIFILTNVLTVALYEVFPTAPPRLTTGLRYHGQPFHFADTVFGMLSGLRIGFNQFAAMPSLHVAWALIVGLTLAWTVRPMAVRLLALTWPALMVVTVVVTGNHYLADAGVAAALVGVAILGASSIEQWHGSARASSSAGLSPSGGHNGQ